MTIGVGTFKFLTLKRQSALGVKAPAGAAGSAQYQRRVTSSLVYNKQGFGSNEVNRSQMQSDFRHGSISTTGALNQELVVGGHQQPIESVLRQVVQAGYNSGALTTVTAASLGAGTYSATMTRAAGDWGASAKFKIGDVVDVTGWTAPATANNRRAVIALLTPTVMTLVSITKTDFVSKASGDSVTITLAGKKAWYPSSGHVKHYYTIEEFQSDLGESEQFWDSVFTGLNYAMQPNGMVTLEIPVMGLDADTLQAEYFTTPAAEPTGAVLASATGVLLIDGIRYGTVTSFTLNADGHYSAPGGVVGNNKDPDIFPGVMTVGVQLSVLFENVYLRDKFRSETVGTVTLVLHDASDPIAPNFHAIHGPKCKFNSHAKDDGQTGLTATVSASFLENKTGSNDGTSLRTILSIQDSGFV
jgi:hypothetical protein